MKLTELIEAKDAPRIYTNRGAVADIPDVEVFSLSCNSREDLKDAIFVALKGTQSDGHAYIRDALRRGARAIVFEDSRRIASLINGDEKDVSQAVFIQVADSKKTLFSMAEKFYGHPSKHLTIIGITGTNGKTTVSYLIEAIVRAAGAKPAVIGTVNYRYNNKVIASVNTTPGIIELQRLFRDMAEGGVTHCAMEVSSHALDQDRIAGIRFSCGIFTNLTQDHLDYHKDMEKYFLAKSKLFACLDGNARAVINQDDEYGRRLKGLTKARIITYGLDSHAQVIGDDIKLGTDETRFTLCARDEKCLYVSG